MTAATPVTHGIRFEVAQDVLGALLAHWSEAAAEAFALAPTTRQAHAAYP